MTLARFKTRLAMGVVLLNLLVLMVIALTLYESRRQHVELASTTAQNLSRLIEQDLDSSFHKIDLTLLYLVDEVNRRRSGGKLDASGLNDFIARQVERQPEISHLRMADTQGRLRYGTGLRPDAVVNVGERDFFIRQRDNPDAGLIVSKPVVSYTSGKWQLVLTRRLSQPDGSFAGMVIALIELDRIATKFSALNIGRHGIINLYDDELAMVARYPLPKGGDVPVGQKIISPQFAAQLLIDAASGVFQATSPIDRMERTFSYRKVGNFPFYTLVGLAATDYLVEWWKEVIEKGVLLLIFAIVTIMSAWLLSRAWERLLQQEQKFRVLLESAPYALVLSDTQGRIVLINDQAENLLGYQQAELAGQPLEMLMPERFRLTHVGLRDGYTQSPMFRAMGPRNDLWVLTKQGHEIPVHISLSPIQIGKEVMIASAILDISERKVAEEKIEFLAYHDALTGLPNRRLLADRLQRAQASNARSGRMGAVFLMDMDNFKTINDTQGHDKGDLLLQQVGQRLLACVREGDTVARLGGDEFVVMVEDLSANPDDAATQAETLGEKILAELNHPYQLGAYRNQCTPSIGITLFHGQQSSIEELLKQADLAMYQSKAAGRNTLHFFDPRMQALVSERAALEGELREAIRLRQFIIHYQPQAMGRARLTGAEALVRWQHPTRGLLSPNVFIPLAEETNLVLPLGAWVLETACSQLAKWAAQPDMAHFSLAVNISANQLHQTNFVNEVLDILARTGANPKRLKLELTESLLVSNVEDSIAKMRALKAHGVDFSMDDFGTGYSSLSFLKQLPLSQLKIDQGFVRDVLLDPNDAAIAKMIIALGESMGLTVIAEGVETEAQRDFLAGLGCHAYQGYLFSRPLPLAEFEAFAAELSSSLE